VTWVSEPITSRKPTDEEIWGEFWTRYSEEVT
jgi:sulfoacetaldehyde dehydrogenase